MLALTTPFEETQFYKDIVAIGKEEWIGKGMEEGIEKGIKKGKTEEKIEIAKALLGILDIKIISEKIGLSVKDIKKLSTYRLSDN